MTGLAETSPPNAAAQGHGPENAALHVHTKPPAGPRPSAAGLLGGIALIWWATLHVCPPQFTLKGS